MPLEVTSGEATSRSPSLVQTEGMAFSQALFPSPTRRRIGHYHRPSSERCSLPLVCPAVPLFPASSVEGEETWQRRRPPRAPPPPAVDKCQRDGMKTRRKTHEADPKRRGKVPSGAPECSRFAFKGPRGGFRAPKGAGREGESLTACHVGVGCCGRNGVCFVGGARTPSARTSPSSAPSPGHRGRPALLQKTGKDALRLYR